MVLIATLPPVLASAIPSIRWPLSPVSSPPLHFLPLSAMKVIRSKQSKETSFLGFDTAGDLIQNLPCVLDELFPPTDVEKRHFGLVSVALILLGNGFTDEAHDLVTPMSWPEDTHFGHGPSIFSSVDSSAKSYATYVHCLVHRREAFNVGEFGMAGWHNANYWSSAVLRSPGLQELPHGDLISEVRRLVESQRSNLLAQSWGHEHGFSEDNKCDDTFESRAVHKLCADAMSTTDEQFRFFAEKVAETEVRILLTHALRRAGYASSVQEILAAR